MSIYTPKQGLLKYDNIALLLSVLRKYLFELIRTFWRQLGQASNIKNAAFNFKVEIVIFEISPIQTKKNEVYIFIRF